jgi:hypothetical protein
MRAIIRNCLAFLFMFVLFLALAWVFGITPDGLFYGRWADTDDHPTNWDDSAQHPEAREAH